jgi:hypothetical protein
MVRRWVRVCLVATFIVVLNFLALGAWAQTPVALSSLETNNTSACAAKGSPSYCYAGFAGMTDELQTPPVLYNPPPGNVSKRATSTLLYSGNNTYLFVHFQPWFYQNATQKAATGYNSNDKNTVAKQIGDMKMRGFHGVVIDWYGKCGGDQQCSGSNAGWDDGTTQQISSNLGPSCKSAQSCPFYFSIMEDKGSLEYQDLCDPTTDGSKGTSSTANCIAALERDLSYMATTYFTSNAYMKVDATTNQISPTGRPVVFLFMLPASDYNQSTTDWSTVWSTVTQWAVSNAQNPLFYFESIFDPNTLNSVYGWPATMDAGGAYAWPNWNGYTGGYLGQVFPGDPVGYTYLTNDFYAPSVSYDTKENVIGASWKGFDDANSWGHTSKPNHPVMPQECGLTWINAFKQMNQYYSKTGTQLPWLGITTWNDYDEGSEIETGIDNCVTSFTESFQTGTSTLDWTINFGSSMGYAGSEDTVYQYVVYYTTDGVNLTQVHAVAAKHAGGTTASYSSDVCTYTTKIPNGATVYVQAQGEPSIFNHLVSSPQVFGQTCP